MPLAGKAALHGLQPVSRPCTVRLLCRCIPQGRVTHMGSATPGMACALDVVGTPCDLGPGSPRALPFCGLSLDLAVGVETMYRSVAMPLRPPGKSNSYGFSHAR